MAADSPPEVHVLTNADLRAGRDLEGLDDPEGIAPIAPSKRAALLSNPLLGPDDDAVQILVAVGPRIAGRLDLVANEIETPDGAVPCFWGSALYVSPEIRGKGLGGILLGAAEARREGAAACGPSRLSHPVYLKRGYLDLALERFVLVRHTQPLVEHWLGRGLGARVATAAADAAAGAHRALLGLARKRARGLRHEPCAAFPSELAPRLEAARAPFAFHRSGAWLDWVVRESFVGDETHRRALHLVTDSGGEVVAYFLVKARVYSGVTKWKFDRLDLGSLVDWGIFEPRAVRLEHLILLALEALDEWKVAAMEVCLPAGGPHLRWRGFLPVAAQHVMVLGSGDDALTRPEARLPGRWSVRPGEGDYAFS